MANTYEAIATVTVGSGGAASIDFSSIPQTYTDLQVVFSLRGTTSQIYILTDIYFNGSTSGFSSRGMEGTGSSAVSYTNSSIYTNAGNGATSTSSTFSSHSVYIPNYTAAANKSVSVDGVLENNASTAYVSMQAGIWSNTSAITSIQIIPRADSYVQHSTAYLYGIVKS
jgi:hypothetical protein